MAADPSKLGYFSLPGEIRNKIVKYVLVPGDIHPHRPELATSTQSPDSTAIVESRPGIQLMATCKQAYQEGHMLYYSSNIFHLPPVDTFGWVDRLQPKHKAMIKRVRFPIGLVNLSPALLDRVDSDMSEDPLVRDMNWWSAVADTMLDVWKSKLEYIVAWESLDEAELCSLYFGSLSEPHDQVAQLGSVPVYSIKNEYWSHTLGSWHYYVYLNMATGLGRVDWVQTKAWLTATMPDETSEGYSSRIMRCLMERPPVCDKASSRKGRYLSRRNAVNKSGRRVKR